MANENDTGYDPREWEAVGGKRPLRPSPEFMADPDVQRQMDFNDFINSPEGEKWLLEQLAKMNEHGHRAGPIEGRLNAARDMAGVVGRTLMEPSFMPAELAHKNFMAAKNRSDLRSKTEDVSRKVLADEEEKLAPKHDKPLAADTE